MKIHVASLIIALTSFIFCALAEATQQKAVVIGIVTNANGPVVIGDSSSKNRLKIKGHGTLIDTDATVGNNPTSSSNTVDVTGSRASWLNSGILTLGNQGGYNRLTLKKGTVSAADLIIGAGTNSFENRMLISEGNISVTVLAARLRTHVGRRSVNASYKNTQQNGNVGGVHRTPTGFRNLLIVREV